MLRGTWAQPRGNFWITQGAAVLGRHGQFPHSSPPDSPPHVPVQVSVFSQTCSPSCLCITPDNILQVS